MTIAVDEARAKFREIRDLLPLEPLAFSLSGDQLKPLQWKFTVESIRVPEDAKLSFSWDFGDGATEGPEDLLSACVCAKSACECACEFRRGLSVPNLSAV